MTQIRLSYNSLMIEKGRHRNFPVSERLCTVFNSKQIENKEHFLLHSTHNEQDKQNEYNI